MTITTKFNYGDRVWFLNKKTPQEVVVKIVHVMVYKTTDITYSVSGHFLRLHEHQLFANKQALLDSL